MRLGVSRGGQFLRPQELRRHVQRNSRVGGPVPQGRDPETRRDLVSERLICLFLRCSSACTKPPSLVYFFITSFTANNTTV